MPLQIEVQKGKITAGSGGNLGLTFTMTLICWNEGVVKQYPVRNPDDTVDMKNAVLFQDFTGYIKSKVEGKTINQLVQEAATKVKVEMQTVIDKYKKEKQMEEATLYESARAGIEGALEG